VPIREKKPRLSEAEKLRILNLATSGKNDCEIAEMVGRPTTTIFRMLRKLRTSTEVIQISKSNTFQETPVPLGSKYISIFGKKIPPENLQEASKIGVKINKCRDRLSKLMRDLEKLRRTD